MVRWLWAVPLLFCAGRAAALPAYQVDKYAAALGEPIALTLNARPGVLEHADLQALARHFEIRNQTLNSGASMESLSLTLYPLARGRWTLRVPGLPGRPPVIRIGKRSDLVPEVDMRVAFEPMHPYVRQPVRFTLEACDDGNPFWTRPVLPTQEGLFVQAMGEQQVETVRNGRRCTAHRWRWAITPTMAGPLSVSIPMLKATELGHSLRFPPPRARTDARPLPAWLPDQAAVGQIHVRADSTPTKWPLNRPLALHITIIGGYTLKGIRALLDTQLAGRPAFAEYPPAVAPLSPADDSPLPRFAVTLYAMPRSSGRLTVPSLTFPWFDPASGRVRNTTLPAAQVRIFDPARGWVLRSAAALLGLLVLSLLVRRLQRAIRWRRARNRVLAAISSAETPAQIALALRAFRFRPERAPAPTLGVWLSGIGACAPDIGPVVERLERACYGPGTTDVAPIRKELLSALRHIRPTRGECVVHLRCALRGMAHIFR